MREEDYSLFGCDYPVPAELLKVYRQLVPATPSLLAALVAIESNVPLDPGAPSRVELLRLHLEIRRVFRSGVGLDQSGVPAMSAVGTDDLQRHPQIIPGVFEPLGHHSSELDRYPSTPTANRPRMLRGQGWPQLRLTRLARATKNPLQRDRHRFLILRVLQADRLAQLPDILIRAPYPQG